MRIHRLTAFQIPITLKKPVRHASHERRANETLILRCVMDDGSCGWGEGLPRPYVTGESMNSAWRHLQRTDFTPLRDATFSSASDASLAIDAFRFADAAADPGIDVRECFSNSVRCALELAILDAACHADQVSLGDFILQHPALRRATVENRPIHQMPGASPMVKSSRHFPSAVAVKTAGDADGTRSVPATFEVNQVPFGASPRFPDKPDATAFRLTEGRPVNEVFYSGAVTSTTPRGQWISAIKMRLYAFRQVKVKVGADGISDSDLLRRVRRIVGRKVDLRLDANEAWHCDEVASKMAPLMRFLPTSLEQPVSHREVAGLRQVRSEINVPIMLDESLCCREDAERAIVGQWCDLFNIRLSKCGGISRSLELVALARQHGVGYQLGCQVGETGILSAAGRHFACNVPDIRYLEGSFDRFLVRESLTEQDLTFRYGGKGPRLHGPGLSIDINECKVRELAVRTLEIIVP